MRTVGQIDRVLGALDGVYALPTGEDRRRAPRLACQAPITIQIMHEQTLGEMLMLNLRDYSAVGLGLCHHAPLNIGQELLLKLGRGAASVSVVCTVVVCREIGESLYQIGAEFTRLLGDIALDEPVRLNWIKPSSFPIARGAAAA